jgi:hypothetical protein
MVLALVGDSTITRVDIGLMARGWQSEEGEGDEERLRVGGKA